MATTKLLDDALELRFDGQVSSRRMCGRYEAETRCSHCGGGMVLFSLCLHKTRCPLALSWQRASGQITLPS